MRKVLLYIATDLTGKIARADGSVTWLENIPNPDNADYGYLDFYKKIGITIQGYNTYKQVKDWGIEFPYADKKNYVITRKQGLKNTEYVDFISENHTEFIKQLKAEKGDDIWLIGGGQINTLFLNANLIDEIYLYIMPIILPDGLDLFAGIPKEATLKLINNRSFASGAIELVYSVEQ